MNASVVTALGALAGAAIGGFTTLVASWLQQRAQKKEQRLAHYQLCRQELYKEFLKGEDRALSCGIRLGEGVLVVHRRLGVLRPH
jgi:hypothetical protein